MSTATETKKPETHRIGDIAKMLGVSRETVSSWIKSGELAAVDVSMDPHCQKRRFRVRSCDLEAFIERRRSGGIEPEKPQPPQRRKRHRERDGVIPFYPEHE